MVLSEIITELPVKGADAAAYDGGEFKDGKIVVKKGETVDFTSFFNAFDAGFYSKYTTVGEVKLKLDYVGRACVVIIRYAKKGKPKDMSVAYTYERVAAAVSENGCEIDVGINRGGILGFVFRAESDGVEISGGRWECDDSCRVNSVRAGFVICTYKRESDALRNAAVLSRAVGNAADIYVVDNGNTLKTTDLPKNVSLLPCRNLGGSGGFSRGMAECINNGNTHFVLMDDDIVFDGRTVRKTLGILEVLKADKKQISIGGAMMSFTEPSVVYEAGAYVGEAKLRLPKHNVKIAEKGGLVWCAEETKINYSGWWYFCAPVSLIKEKGLSMPFFIKYDDAEFGLRTSEICPVVCPLGIGVWHQDFETKLPPYMYYYLRRNSLITSAATGNGSLFNATLKLWGSVVKFFRNDKKALAYVFDGYDDYLKGTEFLEKTDGEELHDKVRIAPVKERNAVGIVLKAFTVWLKLLLFSAKINAGYRDKRDELCSLDAWKSRFETDK